MTVTDIMQVRQEMVSNCQWGVAHHLEISYNEIRPIPRIARYTLPFTTDCSGFVTMMAQWSGAADPNGSGFNGNGDTDTILAHSKSISRDETQPGDLVVFYSNPSTHVVALVESAAGGHDAQCVSHGRQGDPDQTPLSVQAATQAAINKGRPLTLTFLQLQAASGGTTSNPPAAAVTPSGMAYVFWRGTGGDLWQAFGQGGQQLQGPYRQNFTDLATAPAVGVDSNNHTYVFWTGTDGNLRGTYWDNGWQPERNYGFGPLG